MPYWDWNLKTEGTITMLKATPHPNYPAEAGRYIRGNDASLAAVAIVLNTDTDTSCDG